MMMARDEDRGEPRQDRPEMDCGHVEPLLSSYLLGELGPPDRGQVDSHLGGCAKCREELDLLRATAEVLAKSPPPGDVPAGVEREPLLRRARVLYQRPTRLWWAVTAAAALVVVGTSLVIYRVEQRN